MPVDKKTLCISMEMLPFTEEQKTMFVKQYRKKYRKISYLGNSQVEITYSARKYKEFDIRVMFFGFLSEYLDQTQVLESGTVRESKKCRLALEDKCGREKNRRE
mgnify:CR=1 FL=1